MERELEDLQADWERFERKLARQRKIGLWLLIPYVAGAVMIGIGIADVIDHLPEMRRAAILLFFGFALHFGTQWAQPYWTKWITDRKSAPSDD